MTEGQLIALLTGPDGLYQCDARELHSRLQVGRDFSNWIKDRIEQYGFIEGEDYSPNLANRSDWKAGKRRIDYHLTLDMAKELAMIENNEIGRQVRRYFIRAENDGVVFHHPPGMAMGQNGSGPPLNCFDFRNS